MSEVVKYKTIREFADCTLFKQCDDEIYTLRDKEGDVLMMCYTALNLDDLEEYGENYSLANIKWQREEQEKAWRRTHCV